MWFALLPDLLFDGASFRTDHAVVVEEGRVVAILPVAELPPDVERRSVAGTLSPGLIDHDVALLSFPEPWGRAVARTSWGRFAEEGLSSMVSHRESALLSGVTTVIDMGSATGPLSGIRRRTGEGRIAGPTVRGSGPLITTVDGHPVSTDLVGDHDTIEQGTAQVATPAEAREAVDGIVADGWDRVVVVLDAPEGATVLDDASLRAAVSQAHDAGLPVAARVMGPDGARRALEHGVDALHGAFVAEPELLEELANAGASWTPSLTAAAASGADMARLLDSVREAHLQGVDIVAGSAFPRSDGARLGDEVYRELGWLAQAGLTPAEALAAATEPLQPGQPADLIWFEGDLRRSLPSPAEVRQVWKGGHDVLVAPGEPTDAVRSGLGRTSIVPQGYGYWEPIRTGVLGAGFSAFDVANTGTVAILDVQYAFLNQLGADLLLETPSPVPRTSLSWGLHYDGFDALWYGRGNDTLETDAQRYNDTLLEAALAADTELGSGFAWTTGYRVGWTDVRAVEPLPDAPGFDGGWLNTLSLAARWDGRDHPADPWRGTWVQASVDLSDPLLGATHRSTRPALELRHYQPLVDWHILAGRVRAHQAFGSDVPFQQLPEFGGSIGRGYNPDRFVDALSLTGQLEYRGRVYRAAHVAAFVDVGQVASGWRELSGRDWRVAVGGGPRVRFNSQAILAWDLGVGLAGGRVDSFNIVFRQGHAF